MHALNYHAKTKRANASQATLLGSDGGRKSLLFYYIHTQRIALILTSFFLTTIEEPDQDPAQNAVSLAEQQWVNRCRSSAIIVSIAWVAWVLVVQVFLTDIFPVGLFVRTAEQGEYTGW